jgi:hypothetical protein
MSVPSIDKRRGSARRLGCSWPRPTHGIDPACAAGEQSFAEAPGRGADVEADAPGGIAAELVERGRELDAATRHIRVRGLCAERGIDGHFLRGLGDDGRIGRHPSGGDGGLCLRPALEQAALDEQAIDADAGSHGGAVSSRSTR